MNEIEIITQIEEFYNSAWDKLIITGSIIFAVFGLIVPFVFQLLQNRQLKLQEKDIKLDIEKKLDVQKEELQKQIKKQYQDEINKLSIELNKRSMALQGMGCHLQGNYNLKDNLFFQATMDYLRAVQNYLIGADLKNFQSIVRALKNIFSEKITKSEINDIFKQMGTTSNAYFESLMKFKYDVIVSDLIIELKYCIETLPEKR